MITNASQSILNADKMVQQVPWGLEEGAVAGGWSGPGNLCGDSQKQVELGWAELGGRDIPREEKNTPSCSASCSNQPSSIFLF